MLENQPYFSGDCPGYIDVTHFVCFDYMIARAGDKGSMLKMLLGSIGDFVDRMKVHEKIAPIYEEYSGWVSQAEEGTGK